MVESQSYSSLQNVRILIAVAAFDFSQIPHLEEMLDSYQDLCVTGASKVHMVIHATGEFLVGFPCKSLFVSSSFASPQFHTQ